GRLLCGLCPWVTGCAACVVARLQRAGWCGRLARMRDKGHAPVAREAIFTVGHSTLPIERFVALLQGYGIEYLADIRTIPRSRRNPQFEGAALGRSLSAAGIEYVAMPA